MKIRDTAEPTMSREEMADDYARLKREYTLLHQDYRRAIRKQCDIPVVSGMLKHRSGVKGVFVKSFYPTGKPLTTVIETDKGYYCAPSDEFVDA
jgi:hypothetical protein